MGVLTPVLCLRVCAGHVPAAAAMSFSWTRTAALCGAFIAVDRKNRSGGGFVRGWHVSMLIDEAACACLLASSGRRKMPCGLILSSSGRRTMPLGWILASSGGWEAPFGLILSSSGLDAAKASQSSLDTMLPRLRIQALMCASKPCLQRLHTWQFPLYTLFSNVITILYYSLLFSTIYTILHYSPLFPNIYTIPYYSPLLSLFFTVPYYSPLFPTILYYIHYSPLFPTILPLTPDLAWMRQKQLGHHVAPAVHPSLNVRIQAMSAKVAHMAVPTIYTILQCYYYSLLFPTILHYIHYSPLFSTIRRAPGRNLDPGGSS
jgi:hypothetical protein